jgi:hypothetical protein
MNKLRQFMMGCLFLAIGGMSIAADAPWPPNHSSVYVAAQFPETHPAIVEGNKPPDLPALKACNPLEIYRSGMFVILTDDGGIQRWLAKKNDWRPLLHASQEACEAFVKAHGLPRVVTYTGEINKGNTFRIVPKPTAESK